MNVEGRHVVDGRKVEEDIASKERDLRKGTLMKQMKEKCYQMEGCMNRSIRSWTHRD